MRYSQSVVLRLTLNQGVVGGPISLLSGPVFSFFSILITDSPPTLCYSFTFYILGAEVISKAEQPTGIALYVDIHMKMVRGKIKK